MKRGLACAWAGMAIFTSLSAQAADENFDVYVFSDAKYDDNVFRVADSAEAFVQNGTTTQDDISLTYGVGANVRIPVSRQQFNVDAELRRTSFDRFSQLDNNNGQLTGEWLWAYASRASGTFSYDYERRIADFFVLQTRTQDTLVNQRFYGDARIPIHPRWTAVVGADASNISFSERPFLDHDSATILTELLFQTRAKTFVGVSWVERATRFDSTEDAAVFGAIDNDFDETTVNAVLRWDATDKSRFSGALGRTTRSADDENSGDFSGTTGSAEYRHVVSGKTSVDFELYRRTRLLGAFANEVASLVVTDGIAIEPRWNISPKLRFDGRISYEEFDFQGARFVFNGSERADELLSLRARLSYSLNRALTLSVGLGHQSRDSNVDNIEFDQNELNAGIRFRI